MRSAPDGGFLPYRGKRLVDLALVAVAALPAGAIGLVCALAIRLTSPGPVFFRQERIGIGGEPFQVWKFRTMITGDNPIFPDPDRITGVGRWLRRSSLDELPQLINVAEGAMSVVGPRPTLRYQVERYDDHQRLRLSVRPGLTGLAQIRGRNALGWDERIEHDIEYVRTQSSRLDLAILAASFRVVISGEGVEEHPHDDALAAPIPDRDLASELDPGTRAGRASSGGIASSARSSGDQPNEHSEEPEPIEPIEERP